MTVVNNFPNIKRETLSPKEFLEKNVPAVNGADYYVIKPLWGNHFRVNYYKKLSNGISTYSELAESYFLTIKKEKDSFVIINKTMEEKSVIARKKQEELELRKSLLLPK